jgi:GNAT superfamily N-acetyltransferase
MNVKIVELASSVRNAAGQIVAAVTGHTWGGTAYVTHLWVESSERHKGLGAALMGAVESEARRRGCGQILLGTHSFQAPGFYERLGYARRAAIPDYPRGHAIFYYVKDLALAVQPQAS